MELSRVCEACGDGTVRTICNECREFYCQNCSDYHLRFKATRDHHLIDLHPKYGDQQTATKESADEDKFPSNFMEHLTLTENTVLYRAQVAVDRKVEPQAGVERGAIPKRDENKGTKKESSSTQDETANQGDGTVNKDETPGSDRLVKDSKIEQFRIKRPDDLINAKARGILVLSQNIIVADSCNAKLKLFDLNGEYTSSVVSKHEVWGITAIKGNRFATCGIDKQVRFWNLPGKTIVTEDISYDVDHTSDGMHYNGTYYCVLQHQGNTITVLGAEGRQVRKIIMNEALGRKIRFGGDIHMDKTTHNMYVPCRGTNDAVLCLSMKGEPLWFTQLKGVLGGITVYYAYLIVIQDKVYTE